MTTKQIKFYQTLLELAKQDYISDISIYLDFLRYATDYDLNAGLEMWEALFSINEASLESEEQRRAFSTESFYVLAAKSEMRTVKAVATTPTLTRALYMYAPDGLDTFMTKMIADYVLTNKLSAADEAFKALAKNPSENAPYGTQVKLVIEKLFVELLKRMGGGKTAMTKKQNALLLGHINKIKTPEKALLVQRLKEIS